ncbi:MAG: hypothetical protein ACYSR6_13600 [Planctomycetota bacterium]|jgi:hypothetical protein
MANVVFFEGFETVGTETGLGNQSTTRPRVELRFDSHPAVFYGTALTGLVAADDSAYLTDDAFTEGYALHMGDAKSAGNTLCIHCQYIDELAATGAPGDGTPTVCVGFRFKNSSSATNQAIIFSQIGAFAGSPPDYTAFMNPNIELRADGTDLIVSLDGVTVTTLSSAIALGTWHYVEAQFKAVELANGGFLKINIDGTEVYSNSGDWNGGNAADPYVLFQFGNGTNDLVGYVYDDIYISIGAEFLGKQRIYSLPPTSDSSVAWTPDTGTDNYARIDENGVDDPPTTGYVDGVSGQKDKYGCTDLAAVGDSTKTINAAKVEVECLDSGATGPTIQVGIDIGGEDGTSETVSDAANYQVIDHVVASSNWNEADIDAAKVYIGHS